MNKGLTNLLRIRFLIEQIGEELDEVVIEDVDLYTEKASIEQKDSDIEDIQKAIESADIKLFKIKQLFLDIDEQEAEKEKQLRKLK